MRASLVVAAVGALVAVMPASLPHLSSYYDQSTFYGRLKYNWALCNPLGLRWNELAVKEAQATVGRHLGGAAVPVEELQHAQTVLAVSAPHGSLLLPPCRTSGWALATVPVMAFIVTNAVSRPTSLPHIVFGQWLNQTQNAAVTWSNRPPETPAADAAAADASSRGDMRALAAYCAACATAIPIAVGAAFGANRSAWLKPLGKFAPYPAVALANTVNTGMMRADDLRHGVPLRLEGDPLGGDNSLGSSRLAGQRAVGETALTRTLIPLANFVAVPLIMSAIDKLRGGNKPRSLVTQVAVTGAVLVAAIPLASSVSPPIGRIKVEEVEPHIAEAARRRDPGVKELVFERGF